MAAKQYKVVDNAGVVSLATQLLNSVNTRIEERIVTSIDATSDDRHVPSALAVYRAIAATRHASMLTIEGDINEEVPVESRSATVIYLQRDSESDQSWSMYVWSPPETEEAEGFWIQLGTTDIDLSNYWSKSTADVNSLKNRLGLNTKVDEEQMVRFSEDEIAQLVQMAEARTSVFGPELPTFTLTINYLFKENESDEPTVLAPAYVRTGLYEGDTYSVKSPEFDDYYVPRTEWKTVTGTVSDEDVTIDIYYDQVDEL